MVCNKLNWSLKAIPFLVLGILSIAMVTPSQGATELTVFNITANNATDAQTGEDQISIKVTDRSGGMDLTDTVVIFTITNDGDKASFITDVYFDDGSLLGPPVMIDADDNGLGDDYTGIADYLDTDYSTPANNEQLPGGDGPLIDPDFETTAGFSADPDTPQPNQNAIGNGGESLGILFELQGTQTLLDVLEELHNGDLRIGMHVQGFDGGGSESFVNNPGPDPTPGPTIPLPAAAWMGLSLLGGIGIKQHRQQRGA